MDHESPGLSANLGVASVVTGLVAAFLFFLPVMGIPLSLFGLGFGAAGIAAALFSKQGLRNSLAGVAVSCLALFVNLLIS